MGYEITYYYKEADESPGTYQDELLSKTSKIGKFDEDIPLEVLAGKIMAQLARRNILIVDIEIFEYTKKRINYKETESGISIKNKKFSFDSGAAISSSENDDDISEILEDKELLEKLKKHLGVVQNAQKLTNIAPRLTDSRKVLRHEIYDPELLTKAKVDQKGYKFTQGKRYPIYSEKSIGMGVVNYSTKDDTGKEVEVNSECFVVPSMGLSFNEEAPIPGAAKNEVDLWKNNAVHESMPDIRGR